MNLELPVHIKCYNGCFDSKTQAVIDEQERVLKLIRTKYPETKPCYFHMEGKWTCSFTPLDCSSEFFPSRGSAIVDEYERAFK